MPETAAELHRLLDLDVTRNPSLQDVLIHDPAATVALFRRLEQARPGAFEQVSEIAHAVSMIGMEPVRRMLNALPELPPIEHSPGDRAPTGLAYSQAAHAAIYAAAIADRAGMPASQALPTAALLQNPAMIALWSADPEAAQRASCALRDGVSADIAFGAEIGVSLGEANRHLAEAWALPRLARQAMAAETPSRSLQVVRIADKLAESTAAGWANCNETQAVGDLAAFLRIEPDQATGWLHRLAADAARTLDRFDYPLPGFELMLLPAQTDDEDEEDMPEMRFFRSKQGESAPSRINLNDMMAGLMKQIRDETGAERVVFAMLSPDRIHLRTRLALGGDANDGIRRLNLPMARTNLFVALMSKSQSVWINTRNRAKYRNYLPGELSQHLDGDGGYVMSIFIDDQPLGLVYADRGKLSEAGYQRFRGLCMQLGRALAATRVPPGPRAGESPQTGN